MDMMNETNPPWDEEHDVVVAGSGAGGMTAALVAARLGLDVLLVEKADTFGGTTAVSGGAVWIPNSHHSKALGFNDSTKAVTAYLDRVVGNLGSADLRRTFLERGPEALEFVERNSHLKFAGRKYSPDYKPDLEGASLGGRSMDPLEFDGRELGDAFALLHPPIPEFLVFGGMMVNRTDIDHLLNAFRSWPSLRHAVKLTARFARDRLRHRRGTRLVMGNALAGRLLKSLLELKVVLWHGAPAEELVFDGDRVTGLVVNRDGRRIRVRAHRGVMLATGGFPGSAELRRRFLPAPVEQWSAAPDDNTGAGLTLAERIGAAVTADNSNAVFGAPVSLLKRPDGTMARFPHLMLDRPKPGLIAVNAAGRRFVNEADSYHEFVKAMREADRTVPTVPAFLICDKDFLWTYGLGLVRPHAGASVRKRFLAQGYLFEAPDLRTLAGRLGIDATGLADTVARYNEHARRGEDPEFGKGSTAYNRYMGDATHTPNPCLAPIETGPFYAVKVYPGDIGTTVGLTTDADARVLDRDGRPIIGLYACGNDMNSIMGGEYPGPGITLGPAITFGYIAARHMAGTEP